MVDATTLGNNPLLGIAIIVVFSYLLGRIIEFGIKKIFKKVKADKSDSQSKFNAQLLKDLDQNRFSTHQPQTPLRQVSSGYPTKQPRHPLFNSQVEKQGREHLPQDINPSFQDHTPSPVYSQPNQLPPGYQQHPSDVPEGYVDWRQLNKR